MGGRDRWLAPPAFIIPTGRRRPLHPVGELAREVLGEPPLVLAAFSFPRSSLVWWNASSMVSSERQRRRAADFLAPASKPEQPPGRPYS
jgi:hypothetical protein